MNITAAVRLMVTLPRLSSCGGARKRMQPPKMPCASHPMNSAVTMTIDGSTRSIEAFICRNAAVSSPTDTPYICPPLFSIASALLSRLSRITEKGALISFHIAVHDSSPPRYASAANCSRPSSIRAAAEAMSETFLVILPSALRQMRSASSAAAALHAGTNGA